MLFRNKNPFSRPRAGEEILDGIHLLGTHRVNFYVIEDGRSLTLVDCGFQGHRRYLDEWLGRHGRTQKEIEAVLLTHGHRDHTGFAEDLQRRGVPVYLHPADEHHVRGRNTSLPPQRLRRSLWRPATMGLFLEAAADGVFSQDDLSDFVPLVPDAELDVPGRPKVVPIPGHSPGSVAFHLAERGVLLTGDALMTRDPMLGGTDRAIVFADHTDRNRACLDALVALGPYGDAALLPAHGEAWLEPGSVARAVDEAVIAA